MKQSTVCDSKNRAASRAAMRGARGGREPFTSARAATKRVHATNGEDVGRRFAWFACRASRRPPFRLSPVRSCETRGMDERRTRGEWQGACHVPLSRPDCVCAFLRSVREPDEDRPGAWSGWVCRPCGRHGPKRAIHEQPSTVKAAGQNLSSEEKPSLE